MAEISDSLRKKLRKALNDPGNHAIDCLYWTEEGEGKRNECSCWFEIAKKEVYGTAKA